MPESSRSFRLGVAGPVGTGKSSLIATVCRELASELQLGVITNDIYTDEDARLLRSAGVLDAERIRAVETGACPHTAIRDDVTPNLIAVEDLERDFAPLDVVLVESGGDNLTATFSPALVDAQIFVLDVAGGGDVARKGGPGIARADLLVVNKTDLAPYVGVDVPQMVADAEAARAGKPVLALSRTDPESVAALKRWVLEMTAIVRGGSHTPVDPGPMAPHSHVGEAGEILTHVHSAGEAATDVSASVTDAGVTDAGVAIAGVADTGAASPGAADTSPGVGLHAHSH
jgi:urease accessory protein